MRANWAALRPACAVVVLGWVVVALYCYPGFMSFDSVEQLAQARGLLPYSDWHPPVMALIWKALDAIVAGPFPMILLQSGLFIGGVYVLLARESRRSVAAAATLVVFAWPAVLTHMGVVWKDSLMLGLLVAATAALTSRAAWARYASLVGFVIAAMLRHNAIFAIMPLVVLLSPWPARRGVWAQRGVGFALGVAIFVVAQIGTHALVEKRTSPSISVALFDLLGVLRYAEPMSDAEVRRILDGVPLVTETDLQQRAIRAWDAEGWFGAIDGPNMLVTLQGAIDHAGAVRAAWLRGIQAQPRAYVFARWRLFRELLGMYRKPAGRWQIFNAALEDGPLLASYGIATDRPDWQRRISWWTADLSRASLIFQPWTYFVVALALVVVLRRQRTFLALLLSAIANELALLVVAPSADLRYSSWLMTCALIAFAARLIQWRTPSAPASEVPRAGVASPAG